jgi:ATP-dependent DNA helicase RecQ
VIGHLARAGFIAPSPAPPDRAAGRITSEWNPLIRGRCVASAREAERIRWNQYRAIWGYVEERRCRRKALLAHFGDHSEPHPTVASCEVCDPTVAPAAPAAQAAGPAAQAAGTSRRTRAPASRRGASAAPAGNGGDLDEAIMEVVLEARPAVGRTRAVEILRGGRSKVIEQYSYDSLDAYGAFAHMRGPDVLRRVDDLLDAGRLRSTGGRFPKLRAA